MSDGGNKAELGYVPRSGDLYRVRDCCGSRLTPKQAEMYRRMDNHFGIIKSDSVPDGTMIMIGDISREAVDMKMTDLHKMVSKLVTLKNIGGDDE